MKHIPVIPWIVVIEKFFNSIVISDPDLLDVLRQLLLTSAKVSPTESYCYSIGFLLHKS